MQFFTITRTRAHKKTHLSVAYVKHGKITVNFCVTFRPEKFGRKTQNFSVNFSRRKSEKLFLAVILPTNSGFARPKKPLFSGFFVVFGSFRVSRETDAVKILFHVKLIIYS